jgi:hypothetical protein
VADELPECKNVEDGLSNPSTAPKIRIEMKSSQMKSTSTLQIGEETDYVLELLKKFGLPLTRENYLGLAYPQGIPEDFDETTLPPQIRKES